MPEMGRYCKAYLVKNLRAYPSWNEDLSQLRPKTTENGEEAEETRRELKDDDILYLHENYVVTDGIFKDEHIIFAQVDKQWQSYCQKNLQFVIPTFEKGEPTNGTPSGDAKPS